MTDQALLQDKELYAAIRSALAHLDDPLYLETHELAKHLGFTTPSTAMPPGQLLRRALRLGIEALDPGPGVSALAPQARSYQVLYRYAIGQKSVVSIALELGIGERQAYRDLHRGIRALARVLVQTGRGPAARGLTMPGRSIEPVASLGEEVERLSASSQEEVSIVQALEGAMRTVQVLARRDQVNVKFVSGANVPRVLANRVMLRQAFVNLLSHVVSTHRGEEVVVRVAGLENGASVEIEYAPDPGHSDLLKPGSPYAVAAQLLDSLGLEWTRRDHANATSTIRLCIRAAPERTLLVVDDNRGMIALFKRFLRHYPYRVFGATDGLEAQSMLQALEPDVIILDIMMPDQDGWETLQALRSYEAGRNARVIICSIINDPRLSEAIGADSFLHKPVTQSSLLAALARATSPRT